MENDDEFFIEFADPRLIENKWLGSAHYDQVAGITVRAISDLQDRRTDLRETIDIHQYQIFEGKADLADHFAMFEPKLVESSIRFEQGFMSSQIRFTTSAVAIGKSNRFTSINRRSRRFYLSSPIIFSFLNQKSYKIFTSKRAHKFSIRDTSTGLYKFSCQIFSSIIFSIGKASVDSIDGDVATIKYTGGVEFIPRKSLDILQIYVIARLFEKLLFVLVGDHAGPLRIDIRGRSKKERICEIYCTSPLYIKDRVTPGLERCWTLDKLSLDFGALVDSALAKYSTIQTALELIIDARAEEEAPSRFFKLIRALENIGRNFLPRGSEQTPGELSSIRSLLLSDRGLLKFFDKRINPIFERPNSLGYTIDFAKNFFPFSPITELDKSDITRLRGIEAHARAHQFLPDEISRMAYYSEIIDFVCRGFLLNYLGANYDSLIQGILPPSRFSWFVKHSDDT